MNISFIGAGNVVWHLAPALQAQGHQIKEIYSRTNESAEKLLERLGNGLIKNNLDFSESEADLFIISINDDVINEVSKRLIIPNERIIVHTSGSKPLEIIDLQVVNNKNQTYNQKVKKGVFYPLQTFSKNKRVDFQHIPFCIEANDEATAQVLFQLATQLSNSVHWIDSNQRRTLHVAAVFACNFTNHLLTLSQEILSNQALDFTLLKPLIQETFTKALLTNPPDAQTGPARRGDMQVINKHLTFLKDDPTKKEIYKILSDSILAYYKK
jgi:predicted short-subunit dehydrogenase-like oxidoreductase (DUF2520 family)